MAEREGGILLPPFSLSSCDAYTFAIIRFVLAGYKRIRSSEFFGFFGYSFYSFSYSLEFDVKRYQWYQCNVFRQIQD
jgi:hypothetical protein